MLNVTMSGFPVSIGTGLALETVIEPVMEVYDPSRDVPDKVPINSFDLFMINIHTLIRNVLAALEDSQSGKPSIKAITEHIAYEMDFIQDLVGKAGCKTMYYNIAFQLKQNSDEYKLRLPRTEKQLEEASILDKVTKNLADKFTMFRKKAVIEDVNNILVLTHYPLDLVRIETPAKVSLLESHTGIVKTERDWYTKYFKIPGKDMSVLPLREELLYIFGDHVLFHPELVNTRVEKYEELVKKNIHPLYKGKV